MAQIPTTFQAFDANGVKQTFDADENSVSGALTPHHVVEVNGQSAAFANPLAVGPSAVTAKGGAAHAVVTGGTPVVAVTAGTVVGGGMIRNPVGASEVLLVDLVNPAQSSAPGTNGTTFEVPIGDGFDIPPGLTNQVSVNAASSAHAFVCVIW
jgi:hypothetical protein